MNISFDISLYALQEDFRQPVREFITRLEQQPGLVIERNSLSTQIFGNYRQIMALMTEELEHVFAQTPHTVVVIKMGGCPYEHVQAMTLNATSC